MEQKKFSKFLWILVEIGNGEGGKNYPFYHKAVKLEEKNN